MASGKTHDRSIFLATLAVTPCVARLAYAWGWPILLVIPGCFWGGLYLSPDLDIWRSNPRFDSNPMQRWGLLRWYWRLYAKTFSHRGSSHWPLVGSMVRFVYSLWPLLLVFGLHYWQFFVWLFVGVEVSAIVHYVLDFVYSFRKSLR